MRKTASKKLTCLLLSILMALGSASTAVMAAEGEPAAEKKSALQEISESLTAISYAEYKEEYEGVKRGTKSVTIDAVDYVKDDTDATVSEVSGFQGESAKCLQMEDDGKVTWEINIPETGMYAIKVTYCSVSEKTNSIERMLYINGKVPFSEARYLLMKKNWVNNYEENGRFRVDHNGNELRPTSNVIHK